MVDIFHYKELIEAIHEEASFSKAAKKLHVPQPSLSVMVRKIEEEIGIPLFDRTSKPIRLTETGREYLSCANEIRQIEKHFDDYVDSISNLESGTLRIGANQMFSELIMPGFLMKFLSKYPKITVEITDANTAILQKSLTAGELDLIIDNQNLNDQIFEKKVLKKEHFLLAVPAAFVSNSQMNHHLSYADILNEKHLSKEIPTVNLSCFANDPFILLTKENETRQVTDTLFRKAGITPNVRLEVDRLSTMFRYIKLGAADSLISDTLIQNIDAEVSDVYFYKVSEKAIHNIVVSYKRSKYYSRAMQVFIDELSAYFKK